MVDLKKLLLSGLTVIIVYSSAAQAFAQDSKATNDMAAVRAWADSAFTEMDKEFAKGREEQAKRTFGDVVTKFNKANQNLTNDKNIGTAAKEMQAATQDPSKAADNLYKIDAEKRIKQVVKVKEVVINDTILLQELSNVSHQLAMGEKVNFQGERIKVYLDSGNVKVEYKGKTFTALSSKNLEGIKTIQSKDLAMDMVRIRIIQGLMMNNLL